MNKYLLTLFNVQKCVEKHVIYVRLFRYKLELLRLATSARITFYKFFACHV